MVRRFGTEGYVIAVHPGDSAHSWKKVHSVLKDVVDNELGFSEIGIRNPEATKVIFYYRKTRNDEVLLIISLHLKHLVSGLSLHH